MRHLFRALALIATTAVVGGARADWASAAARVMAANSIEQVVANLTAWIVGILATIATLFLTLGGVRYLMAGGDPGEVEKAKGALRSGAIGYALAVLAPVVVTVLKSLVGA